MRGGEDGTEAKYKWLDGNTIETSQENVKMILNARLMAGVIFGLG